MKSPWTVGELRALLPQLESKLKETEGEFPNARPLPLMALDECMSLLRGLMDVAVERPLTSDEAFLHGQLLCCFQMAVTAETLGYHGRFFVMNDDQIHAIVRQ